jgi:DegV family protein with EDD domain
MSVAIVSDSTSDLPPDLVRSSGVTVVPLTVVLEEKSYLDGVDISADEFYRRNAPATTSQPSPGRFAETYRALLDQHDEVVSLHISERLSGTYAAALQGAAIADPGGKRVRVIDSAMVSMPLGLMVLAAARRASEGADAAEVADLVGELRPHVGVYFVVATLENLRRGGRIGRASALLGSVLQVKPVLTIQEGQVTPLERVRTQEKALGRLVELVRGVDRGHGICAIVGHAAAPEAAERLAGDIDSISDTLLMQSLGPVVGAHAGPGTVGVGCYPAEIFPLGLRLTASAATAPTRR